ncbi:DJ-1/PfpI family protein [Pollutimonas bauzanensis]|uniref:Cyclohexyl-isocyanide hydratase n=1 Tax=Pollutimonas bauzanensis TaxID=658167 RepID=A0A1M6A3X9_9BURK|nr:DJ-1/PfpI family protein [Pollutimonas bauzanensis]SHI31177.1 cyclohexyl-isocyanide hydratase [Pollutimonas bauzanensis]
MSIPRSNITVGFLIFPGITQLDMTGPFEVLSRMQNARPLLIGKDRSPVSDRGLILTPTHDFLLTESLDILVVPGGPGVDEAMLDQATVKFVREKAEEARYVLGICTGSLLLAAAGLLIGRRAGGHWQARDLLARFGVDVSNERTTIDGKYFTAGGVTAGIDMALRVIAEIEGEDAAMRVQLQIEYAPEPLFAAGTPYEAPAHIVDSLLSMHRARRQSRETAVEKACESLLDGKTAPSLCDKHAT